jgi:hypothetical protein
MSADPQPTDDGDPRERAIQRLRIAQSAWGEAMTAHRLAPPDLRFALRLRGLASAAEREREACEAADRAGLLWRPIPGAQGAQPPNELRPGSGRRGPAQLLERFDAAVRELNHAIAGTNVRLVARRFGELAAAAAALAEEVEAEDAQTIDELVDEALRERREAV